MYIQVCYNHHMRPEEARRTHQEVLEHDITENFARMERARDIGDEIGGDLAEADMNAALDEYQDLMKAVGHVANRG